MQKTVLIGDDCQIFSGKLATTETEGNGTAELGKGMYVITAIASSDSFFPTGLKVGDLLPAEGGEVLETGDKVRQLVLTEQADASGWSLSITREKIDVSLLKDEFKKYRYGKKDATGTISSMFTQGVTDQSNGLVGRTMKLVSIDDDGNYVISVPDDTPLYFLGYIRKTEVTGEVEDFIFCQIYMSDLTLGGATGSAQTFDTSFSLTGADPIFYSVEVV